MRHLVPAQRLRLGIVPYRNVLPLLDGLENTIPWTNWLAGTPRELAEAMQHGELDIAIMPTFEVLRAGNLEVLPEAAIGCRGAVRSVQLFCKVPPREVKSILVDISSLTSAHLARVIARDLLRIKPQWRTSMRPFPWDFDPDSVPEDALLAIGDTALAWEGRFPHAVDLGEAWFAMEGLPFVFALWVVRPGILIEDTTVEAFHAARMRGEERAAIIAEEAELPPGVSRQTLREYLTGSIRYKLGARQWLALERYRNRLVSHGLLPPDTPLPRRRKLLAESTRY